MNTKYLKIVLLFSILALSIHCQSSAAKSSVFSAEVNTGIHSSTYNKKMGVYVISIQTNEVHIANVVGNSYKLLNKFTHIPLISMESHDRKEWVAVVNGAGHLHVWQSTNQFMTWKTIWSERAYATSGSNLRLRWHSPESDYLFAGLTNGTACAFLIREPVPGEAKHKKTVCIDSIFGNGWAFREIVRRVNTPHLYFLPLVSQSKVWIRDFFDPKGVNAVLQLKADFVIFAADTLLAEHFYVIHNNNHLVSYYVNNHQTAEYYQQFQLLPTNPFAINTYGHARLLAVYSLKHIYLVNGDGLELLATIDIPGSGTADQLTWVLGESNGYVSLLERAVNPAGSIWSWQIQPVISPWTWTIPPHALLRTAETAHSMHKSTKQSVHNKVRLLMNYLRGYSS
jgi:hypothetical protein